MIFLIITLRLIIFIIASDLVDISTIKMAEKTSEQGLLSPTI